MKIVRIAVSLVVLLALAAFVGFQAIGRGWLGSRESPGEVTAKPVPEKVLQSRRNATASAARARGVGDAKQILFGDLHVHTTYSFDAFLLSLPMMGGEGTHPPADACDFARYCSGLDFWSINDHAEALTPDDWRDTVDTIRKCNAVAGDPENPDIVAYLGWEWTQVGTIPQNHYGHKNVVLRDLEDGKIPTRPIAARGFAAETVNNLGPDASLLAWVALGGGLDRRYLDFARYANDRSKVDDCPEGVPVRDLPADCREYTANPGELFARLDDWGHESIVIPHGTTWGFYTPAGSTWDKQLNAAQHDPKRQTLVEVFSGHGNSEEYRPFKTVAFDADGKPYCPEPTNDHLPSCWRAGEIIRARCLANGNAADVCEQRAAETRQYYVEAGNQGHLSVPGATTADWLDSGQCRDCFSPAFNYRPGSSAQYMLALRNFDEGAEEAGVDRFRFGFMASSDTHKARPGTGYKEYDRREMTEATGAVEPLWRERLIGTPEEPADRGRAVDRNAPGINPLFLVETERQASFFLTGGLIAVHADGRDRNSIWDAMKRREVYGTSGERILLWFELLNGPGEGDGTTELPMGSEAELARPPHFQVRAVGAHEQDPGCPDHAGEALSPERLEKLCRGECYNPSERRKMIDRIEIVRIRPQSRPDEPVDGLIEDPWRIFTCRPDPAGCTVSFHDPEFLRDGRDSVYYARAIQQASPAVNSGALRCKYDELGRCEKVDPCYGDYRTDLDDDCLRPTEERAWSSPIFIDVAAQ